MNLIRNRFVFSARYYVSLTAYAIKYNTEKRKLETQKHLLHFQIIFISRFLIDTKDTKNSIKQICGAFKDTILNFRGSYKIFQANLKRISSKWF